MAGSSTANSMWYISSNRRSVLWAILLLFTVRYAAAQSYEHQPGDTLRGQAAFNDISVFNIIQVHPGQDTLHFRWQRHSVAMPPGWTASICDNGNCYTELRDSGRMAPIVPGDNGLMSLHLDPGSTPGTGVVRYILEEENSGRSDTLTWIISAGAGTAIQEPVLPDPLVYVTDRQLVALRLDGRYRAAALYSADGRLLAFVPLAGDSWRLSLAAYSPGMLLLKLYGKRNFIKSVLNY